MNNVSFEIGPGVKGLLGPNGAGKSTLMKLITGHILPNQGRITVAGCDPFRDRHIKRRMGYVPEAESMPDLQTGEVFLRKRAYLRGFTLKDSKDLAARMLEQVGLEDAASKKIGAYSKGMRQRLKLAQSLMHAPDIIVLDEPLSGLDPVGRRRVIDLIKTLGREGRTVLVSSHILHEIELMTDQVLLIVRGKMLAEGSIEHIRSLIDSHPHTVEVKTARPMDLAVVLLKAGCVVSASLEEGAGCLMIKTRDPDHFYERFGHLVRPEDFGVESFHAPDNKLQAVFDYLVK